jgi:hypothetical protein
VKTSSHGTIGPSHTPLRFEVLEDRSLLSADAVLAWHDIALEAVKVDHALTSPREQFGPTRAARALAIVQGAVYDTVNSLDHSFTPYRFSETAAPGASLDVAVATAAHDTLSALYPSQRGTFDSAWMAWMSTATPQSAQDGLNVGRNIANQMLNWRMNDGANTPSNYQVNPAAGHWSPDPLHPNQSALTPNWGSVTPFTMGNVADYRAAPPPALNSAEYTAAYNEVLRLGGNGTSSPTERTADQTEAGIFWGYDGQPGLCSPPRLYNQIAAQIARQRGNTEVANARFLALVNLALADASIACWDTKYTYDLWRPVTAIRAGNDDGNPDTIGDANWEPFGAPANNGAGTNFTPPFPAYTSGHATFGGAVFEIIRRFYGTDNISFTFVSDEFNGKTFDMNGQVRPIRPRFFSSLSQAEEENGQSRIYLGIHWSFDKVQGILQGNRVADHVFDAFLRRNPTDLRTVVGVSMGSSHVKLFDSTTGQETFSFLAFDPSFTGGVRVALGDTNGDGIKDIIVAQGPGGSNMVRVFNGKDLEKIHEFNAFDSQYINGIYIASGDIDGDGRDDIIVGAGEGNAPNIRVISGLDLSILNEFYAYDPNFRGGVRVASGDVDGDGRDDIITGAGPGAGPHVKVFSGQTGELILSFMAYELIYSGGVFVSAADCDADGRVEIMTGAGGIGNPHVKVFGPQASEQASYFAFQDNDSDPKSAGVRVGCIDSNGDGRSEILTTPSTPATPFIDTTEDFTMVHLNRLMAFDPLYLGTLNI